jgi:hypothetical protein
LYETYIQRPFELLTVQQFASLIHNEQDELKVKQILELYEEAKKSDVVMPKTLDLFNMENLMYVADNRFKVMAYLAYCARIERSRHRKKLVKQVTKDQPNSATHPEQIQNGYEFRTGISYDSQGLFKTTVRSTADPYSNC